MVAEEDLNWFISSIRRYIAVSARCGGSLTLLGSAYILYDIGKDERRRTSTKNRIVLLMSVCDLLMSFFGAIIGTTLVPAGMGVPGAVGNQATCTLQGFMVSASASASATYNVSLAICYLFMIRYDYTDERLRQLELYFLLTPLILSLMYSIPGIFLQVYNFDGKYQCFHAASPYGCDRVGDSTPVECERGELYSLTALIGAFFLCISAFIIILSMVMMYMAILARERGNDRYRFSAQTSTRTITVSSTTTSQGRQSSVTSTSANRRLSNTMRRQGLWYSGAFLISFFPSVLIAFMSPYWLYIVAAFTFNMIGFTNALVYIRPRFCTFRRENPQVCFFKCLWHTLLRTNAPVRSTNAGTTRNCSSRVRSCSFHGIFVGMKKRWESMVKSHLTDSSSSSTNRRSGTDRSSPMSPCPDQKDEQGDKKLSIALEQDNEKNASIDSPIGMLKKGVKDSPKTFSQESEEQLTSTNTCSSRLNLEVNLDKSPRSEDGSIVVVPYLNGSSSGNVAPNSKGEDNGVRSTRSSSTNPDRTNFPWNKRVETNGEEETSANRTEPHIRQRSITRRRSLRRDRRPSLVEASMEDWGILFEEDDEESKAEVIPND